MLRKRLSLFRIVVLGKSLNDGDQRSPINAQSYDSRKVNCDDCGKVLDVRTSLLMHLFIPCLNPEWYAVSAM